MSPLASYSLGGRVSAEKLEPADQRLLGVFKGLNAAIAVDAIKTDLKEFTWGGETPDDTLALLFTLTAGGSF